MAMARLQTKSHVIVAGNLQQEWFLHAPTPSSREQEANQLAAMSSAERGLKTKALEHIQGRGMSV